MKEKKGGGMAWIYLIIAGLLEVVWATWLKKTDGFTRLGPSVITIGVMCVSFYLLGVALKTLPTGTGYAAWVGIGAVGTALVGLLWLGEPASLLRLVSIALIVLGVIGLRQAEGEALLPRCNPSAFRSIIKSIQVATGTVVNGRIVLEGVSLTEGEVVTVVTRGADESFVLIEAQENELLAAMAEIERGEYVILGEFL